MSPAGRGGPGAGWLAGAGSAGGPARPRGPRGEDIRWLRSRPARRRSPAASWAGPLRPLPGSAPGKEPPSRAPRPGLRAPGIKGPGGGGGRSELCSRAPVRLTLPPSVCVWPARGACAPPPSPPAQRRRLGSAAGSGESRWVPGAPGPVLQPSPAPHGAQAGPGRGAPHATPRGCASRPGLRVAGTRRSPQGPRPPLPGASPWRLLEVGGGKQTRRKAKYYECSWGDFRGAGAAGHEREPEAGAGNKGPSARSEELAGASRPR